MAASARPSGCPLPSSLSPARLVEQHERHLPLGNLGRQRDGRLVRGGLGVRGSLLRRRLLARRLLRRRRLALRRLARRLCLVGHLLALLGGRLGGLGGPVAWCCAASEGSTATSRRAGGCAAAGGRCLAGGGGGAAHGSSEGIRQPAGICAQSASRRSTSASRRSVAQNGLNSSSLAYSCSAARRTFAFLSASRARPRRATGPKRSVGSARDSQRCESVASALARTKDDVSCSRSTTEAMRPEAASATSGGRGVGIAATAIWSWPKAETAPQRRVYASEARTCGACRGRVACVCRGLTACVAGATRVEQQLRIGEEHERRPSGEGDQEGGHVLGRGRVDAHVLRRRARGVAEMQPRCSRDARVSPQRGPSVLRPPVPPPTRPARQGRLPVPGVSAEPLTPPRAPGGSAVRACGESAVTSCTSAATSLAAWRGAEQAVRSRR